MGAACFKDSSTVDEPTNPVQVMFQRIDKKKKGYLDKSDLEKLMNDEMLGDADKIIQKYGTNNKMTYQNFELWWNSTYTTYNEDEITKLVEEANVQDSKSRQQSFNDLDMIKEDAEFHNSNVAVHRS